MGAYAPKHSKKNKMKHTRHSWRYESETWNERKVGRDRRGRNIWKFTYSQTKTRRGRKAPGGSGFPVRGRLKWLIRGTQYAVKVGPNKYRLIMKGTKTQGGYKRPHDKRWR